MFAENHNCQGLCQAAELFTHKYFEDVTNHEEFRALKIDDVEQLIKSDELRVSRRKCASFNRSISCSLHACTFFLNQVVSEEPVFSAVIQWVKHSEKERIEFLPRLLQHSRLALLSAKFLTDVVDEEVRAKRCVSLKLMCY